jgi:acetyltransferase
MRETTLLSINLISSTEVDGFLPQLVRLLQDAVASGTSASGSSLGFLPPLSAEDAQRYWEKVFEEVTAGARMLLIARNGVEIAGSVQLALATQPNGRHRAEVQKLIVHSSQRRRGIGRALMQEVEQAAREAGRTLLLLDTIQGNASEWVYRAHGYREIGVIPGYAQSANGSLDNQILFYKMLASGEDE